MSEETKQVLQMLSEIDKPSLLFLSLTLILPWDKLDENKGGAFNE